MTFFPALAALALFAPAAHAEGYVYVPSNTIECNVLGDSPDSYIMVESTRSLPLNFLGRVDLGVYANDHYVAEIGTDQWQVFVYDAAGKLLVSDHAPAAKGYADVIDPVADARFSCQAM